MKKEKDNKEKKKKIILHSICVIHFVLKLHKAKIWKGAKLVSRTRYLDVGGSVSYFVVFF
jgi:hypothetical protein